MKKYLALVLAVAIACSVSSFSALALTAGESDSHSVKASYQAGSSSDTIYSVDITWEELNYTFKDASEGQWNPETHSYTGATAGSWNSTGNKITVKNHSNAAINANFTYNKNSGFEDVNGSFMISGTEKTSFALGSAAELALGNYDNAPSESAQLVLSGKLSKDTADNTEIGTVTVKID